jgi:hypothetical protein
MGQKPFRNPIYVANMLAFSGFAILSGLLWLLLVFIGLMWTQYAFTVVYEEKFLVEKFGPSFREYCAETQRWIDWPLWQSRPPRGFDPYPYGKILKRERGFLLVQIVGSLVLLLTLRLLLPALWPDLL